MTDTLIDSVAKAIWHSTPTHCEVTWEEAHLLNMEHDINIHKIMAKAAIAAMEKHNNTCPKCSGDHYHSFGDCGGKLPSALIYSYEELQKTNQFGSDFCPYAIGICEHPHNRPEPYNNAVIGLTADERVKVAEFVQELRGGMECLQKH